MNWFTVSRPNKAHVVTCSAGPGPRRTARRQEARHEPRRATRSNRIPRIGIYGIFDRIPFLKGRYAQKFAAATVIAVVPPLLILLAYTVFANDVSETGRRLLPALGLTYLGGFMAMLWLHQGLLAPVVMSSTAMKQYLDDGKAPQMPARASTTTPAASWAAPSTSWSSSNAGARASRASPTSTT